MKKSVFIIAAIAAFFMLPFFTLTASAEPDVETPEVTEVITVELPVLPENLLPADVIVSTDETEIPVTDFEVPPPRPFTPSGTGTVVDHATDGDGKEFYTIMTPDENVFYLVIDRQRSSENVYFLNAVTEADLMALAEIPERPAPVVPAQPMPPVEPEPDTTVTPTPSPDVDGGGNMGLIALLIAAVLIGGGAGWYFKIYRPKQRSAGMEEDYVADGYDAYGQDTEQDDDAPPWYDDDEAPEDNQEGDAE